MILQDEGLKLEDDSGSRVARLLRLLTPLNLSFSPTALAEPLDISRASVLRVLETLGEHALIRDLEVGRYPVNTEGE